MTGTQLFWKIVMVVGVLLAVDGIVGGSLLASLVGPTMFIYVGMPQVILGAVLAFFGWTYSK